MLYEAVQQYNSSSRYTISIDNYRPLKRYSNWHLHSSSAYWCYLALRIFCSSHLSLVVPNRLHSQLHLLYCTKNKLKKSASLMVLCLTKRLDSSINFNSLILVNLIKCFVLASAIRPQESYIDLTIFSRSNKP